MAASQGGRRFHGCCIPTSTVPQVCVLIGMDNLKTRMAHTWVRIQLKKDHISQYLQNSAVIPTNPYPMMEYEGVDALATAGLETGGTNPTGAFSLTGHRRMTTLASFSISRRPL